MSADGDNTELLQFLEKANLMSYKEALLEQGADDVEQLRELESEEFEQLCAMVGMDKKPFHIMRLKKALNKPTSMAASRSHPPTTPLLVTIPSSNSTPAAATPSSMATVNLGKSPAELSSGGSSNSVAPATNSDSSPAPLGPNRAFLDEIKKADETFTKQGSVARVPPGLIAPSGQRVVNTSKTSLLPAYLQDSSESGDLSELIDDQTPVQKTLSTCPFNPSMWDPERKELVRKYAIIYGKNFNKRQKELLTPFEDQVNEGAYQLCLRDPTLLVRREELFVLAKRAVKEGGYTYYHNYTTTAATATKGGAKEVVESTTLATTGQKRPHPRDSVHLGIPPPKVIIPSELVDEMPKKMSGRMRQERMNELEKMIVANKTQQAAKLVELEQAQQLCNFSSAFSIQLEVESLGNACQQLQTSYAALKRKQRRSDRYFTLKEREAAAESGGSVGGEGFDHRRQRRSSSLQGGASPAPQIAHASNESDEQQDSDAIKQVAPSRKSFKLSSGAGGGGKGKKLSSTSVTAMVIPSSMSSSQGSATPTSTPGGGVTVATPILEGGSEGEDKEVQDLVKNVSHATDEVNSLMIREFQKQLVWDPINS